MVCVCVCVCVCARACVCVVIQNSNTTEGRWGDQQEVKLNFFPLQNCLLPLMEHPPEHMLTKIFN
jgi:hypothetical protein